MGKSHPDASKVQRQRPRQLSIIYFVDAARTRTVNIPLDRLRWLIAGAVGLVLWSLGSVVLTVHLLRKEVRLEGRLRQALVHLYDFESRDEHVFDVAYPSPVKAPAVAVAPVPPAAPVRATAVAPHALAPAKPLVASGGPPQAMIASSSTPAAPDLAGKKTISVAVGKARFEPSTEGGLDLQLELTNKSGSTRVEGYIYAVAEFVSDRGEHHFISWPKELKVDGNGLALNPRKAAMFGIRRFKDKRFSFPLAEGESGVFTNVRVELLGRSDDARSSFNLAVPSAQALPAEQSRATKIGAPKPG